MASVDQHRFSRRAFLKGLGALALTALPACRRAQQYAIQPEERPEWLLPGEETAFASAMPWACGAHPLLAICRGGVPVSLQPNPAYAAVRPGLPAFVQASLLDLYSPRRTSAPSLRGKPLPWKGVESSFRAWARAMRSGRSTAFLFPAGYSAIRHAQAAELVALPGVSCYAWDPVAEPRPPLFEPLSSIQTAALGESAAFSNGFGSLDELTARLPQIDLLFIFTPADPAAFVPSFAAALQQSNAETIRFSLFAGDETSARCLYHIPLTHFLEEWGAEADAYGNLCLRQPVTLPLVPSLAEAEALHALLHDGELPGIETRQDTPSTARLWLEKLCPRASDTLRRGFQACAAPRPAPLPDAAPTRPYLHPLFVDGRFLHNPWLREAFDPISGYAGAPAAYLPGHSWEPAEPVNMGAYTLPAFRAPGLESPCLPMLPPHAADMPDQWPSRRLRPMPADSAPPPARPEGASPQWGLSIDLSACIGCNACTIACRAENNVPTVGAQEQMHGRDIQWLRLDRYLDTAARRLFIVPAMCRQCRNAACEAVCPVNATVHTSDGLNAMVYPRCWGTRYCAAACPYQARTFNFHDYARASHAATGLPPNPRVTVRSRGVMEKCTCCVQRIRAAKLSDPPHTPTAACQQACPRGAILLVDWAKTPIPARATSRFDTPATQPSTLYSL